MDNAACHPKLDLSNIKLAWFPPNTTSVTQPMDQGIIYCVKLYYRRLLMQSLIANVDKISVVSELSKNITVLQAIQWLNVAVNQLKPQTIKSCFAKAGFDENEKDDKQDDNEEYEDVQRLCISMGNSHSVNDFINVDKNVYTNNDDVNVSIYDQSTIQSDSENEDNEGNNEVNDVENQLKTYKEALIYIKNLEQFSMNKCDSELLETISRAKIQVEKSFVKEKTRQKTLHEFWNF